MKKYVSLLLAFSALIGIAGCRASEPPVVELPTAIPTAELTAAPTAAQTALPTAEPTEFPAETATPMPSPTAEPTPEPSPVPTVAPTPTPRPTAAPTTRPTATPKPTSNPSQAPAYDTVYLGNSIIHSLYEYGLITDSFFLTAVGLNVNTIYTKTDDYGTILINLLNGKTFKKAVFNFGVNEVGWPNQDAFISRYKNLILDVKQRLPEGLKIYVLAITPVTKRYSEGKGQENGITIEHIRAANERVRAMCTEIGAVFVENPSDFYDSEGYLPSDASSDGVHPKIQYLRIWKEHILSHT